MTFLPGLDVDLECCLLLECFAGDPAQADDPALTPAQLRAHYARRFRLSEARADALFGPLEAAYDAVTSRLPFAPESLRADFSLPGANASPACAILLTERFLARVPDATEAERRALIARRLLGALLPDPEPTDTGWGDPEAAFVQALVGAGLSDAAKWTACDLFFRYEARRDAVMDVLAQTRPLLEQAVPLLEPLMRLFREETDEVVAHAGGVQAFLTRYGVSLDAADCPIQPLAFAPTRICAQSDATCARAAGLPERQRLLWGLLFCPLARDEERLDPTEALMPALKALADPRRMQILSMLARGPLYGQEIVQRMRLTPATISHHMAELMHGGLLDARKEGVRYRYALRRDRVDALADALRELLGGA